MRRTRRAPCCLLCPASPWQPRVPPRACSPTPHHQTRTAEQPRPPLPPDTHHTHIHTQTPPLPSDAITYSAVLSALSKGRQWGLAIRVFNWMVEVRGGGGGLRGWLGVEVFNWMVGVSGGEGLQGCRGNERSGVPVPALCQAGCRVTPVAHLSPGKLTPALAPPSAPLQEGVEPE